MKSVFFHDRGSWFWRILLAVAVGLLLPETGRTADLQIVHGHVPSAVTKLAPAGFLDPARRLRLAIGLPPRNQAVLDQLLKDLYDPASPSFHHYLTPAQFAERFGPDQADYQKLEAFALAHHFTVTNRHPNRVVLDVEGSVADIEAAFHLRMRTYPHPTEARQFFAPSAEPSVDLATPILHIGGLDDYFRPHPNLVRKPDGAKAGGVNPQAGSGPSGAYAGGDFRAAYVPGTALTGSGQSVGLLQFDGFYARDIASYTAQFNLPNIPLAVVPIDGGVSVPGDGDSEVSLDIEMVTSMAPGLSTIYVYEAPNPSPWEDLLSRMANDNLSRQLSCSWGGGDPDATAEAIFQQMAAQGQSFYDASGDSDAFTGDIPFPGDSPNITQVGGTTLTTTGPDGSYVSETVWNWGGGTGSGGGISTFYSIPVWQQGVNMSTNGGSTTMRNIPDVALTGDNVYVAYDNGSSGNFGGTSCAAPLWAGFTALVNQQAATQSLPSVGFINPAIYGLSPNFNDITTGNDFSPSSPTRFSAVAGYDLCTGLGTPSIVLISALLGAAPTNLNYSQNPATYTIGFAISPNTPSSLGGRIASYSVTPALPAGLVLDPVTGMITGTPSAVTPAANYTVTGTNHGGSASVVLNIAVNPLTPPTNLTYATDPALYTLATSIAPNIPSSLGGPVASYSISPPLSSGLAFDPATGIISGIPTALSAAKNYTVTAGNDAGSTTAVVNITVSAGAAASKLFVAVQQDAIVGEYDPATGTPINSAFISGLGSPAGLAISGANLFVGDQAGVVGEYNSSTGAAINASFISGLDDPNGLALSGNTLYVANYDGATVGVYNATTGAVINANFVTGLANPQSVAVSGNTLFVADYSNETVGAYNATTGAVINASFIAGLGGPVGLLVSGNTLYVANYDDEAVGTYNATTGAVINANFVTNAIGPVGLAISGNTLYVSDYDGGVVGAYDATTGAVLNANLITGLDGPEDLAVVSITAPPAGLTYPVNPAVYTLGLPISPNVPSARGGAASAFSVSPALPAGLTLDPVTGVISGTPTVPALTTSYLVTAANPLGSTATTLTITVNDLPPSSLTYSTNPATYALRTPITSNVPSSAGSPVLSYSISPALPAGLVFNPTTGVISGTPTATAPAANYKVTATNNAGSATVVLNITVADEAPTNLTYSTNPCAYYLGLPITSNVPSSAGSPVQTYSMSPALPAGLAFDTVTGIISGTPATISPAANYTVTATNDAGSASVVLNISVSAAAQLYVCQGFPGVVSEYNSATGAVINASFISGLDYPNSFAISGNNLFVVNDGSGIVGEYRADTGAVINANFITGLNSPCAPVISGNHFLVPNASADTVGEYDAVTGAAINPNFIVGLDSPQGLAISGNTLYVANYLGGNVRTFDATSGASINPNFIAGLGGPVNLAISGNNLFVTEDDSGVVGEYNASTGVSINPGFITGLDGPIGIAIWGNSLFVSTIGSGVVGEYNLATGAPINANLITGLDYALGVAVAAPLAAPSGLTYAVNPAVYALGRPIVPNGPSSTGGAITSYSVSPMLPAGLALDPTAGIISGTPPTAASPANYTVTATNAAGSTTVGLNITVDDVPPSALTYTVNPAVYTRDSAIAANSPHSSGGAIVSYSVSPALPVGLNLNTTAGIITGTPTTLTAAANYTITATNSGGSTTVGLNITVNDVPPSLLSYSANPAVYTKGLAIPANNPSSNGGAVVSYSVSPALPSGLVLNPSTGVVSGTSMVLAAAQSYVVTATNSGGSTSVGLNLTVNDVPPASLTYSMAPAIYTKGTAIPANNPSNNGGFVVSYSVSPALPAGLTLNTSDGVITGTPTAIVGAATYTIRATNTGGSTTFRLNVTVNDVPPTGLSYATNPAVYTKGTAIAANNPTNGGGAVVSYSVSPSLPGGLSLNPSTGVISGAPTVLAAAGNYTITALNSGGSTIASLNLTVNDVAPSALTYAANPAVFTKGMAISNDAPSNGGGAVVSYSVLPALPAGLALDPGTGVVSGAPTALSTAANYIVTATNTGGSTTATLNVTVNDVSPATLSYLTNPASYRIGGAITANRPSSSGGPVISYAVSPALPAGLTLNPSTGVLTGTPTTITAEAHYTITATNTGGSTTASLDLTILDALPVAVAQTLQATTHEALSITLSATEVIPETTTYTVVTPPQNGVLSGSGANLQYTSNQTFAGADSFTFEATDSGGTSTPATITINVSPAVSKQGYYYGNYVGLISGPDAAHSGTITIMSPGTGDFTASLKYGGVAYPLKGNFINPKNRFQARLAQKNSGAIPVELDFGIPDGPDLVTGKVGGSDLIANNAVYSAKAPAPQAGRYTVKVPPDPAQTEGSTTPQGFGVGTLVVSKSGSIRYAGTLADGTSFSQGTLLTRNGIWYVFVPLYAAKGPLAGMLEGTVQFEDSPLVSDLDGAVVWTKPALIKQPYPKGTLYPLGFDLATNLFGAAFNPKGGMAVTPSTAGNTFIAEHGNLAGGQMSEAATVAKAASGLKITGAGGLALKVAKSTGLVGGSFKEPGAKAASPVNAVIYQKGQEVIIIGNFRDYPVSGANQSGSVTLTSP